MQPVQAFVSIDNEDPADNRTGFAWPSAIGIGNPPAAVHFSEIFHFTDQLRFLLGRKRTVEFRQSADSEIHQLIHAAAALGHDLLETLLIQLVGGKQGLEFVRDFKISPAEAQCFSRQ